LRSEEKSYYTWACNIDLFAIIGYQSKVVHAQISLVHSMSIVTDRKGSQETGGSRLFVYNKIMMTNYTSWAIQVVAVMEDQEVSLAIKLATGMDVDMRKDKKLQAHLLETLLWIF